MTSEKQTLANQSNAAHSTGPRTPEGKAASRLNGLKHGLTGLMCLLPDEEQADYARHCESTVRDLHAKGELEIRLAQAIADDNWRIDRIRRIEQTLFLLHAPDEVQVTIDHHRQLSLYSMYETRLNRNIKNNLAEFRRLQDDRSRREDDEAAIAQTHAVAVAAGLTQPNGFAFPYRSIPEMMEAERQSHGPCEPIDVSDLGPPQRKNRR